MSCIIQIYSIALSYLNILFPELAELSGPYSIYFILVIYLYYFLHLILATRNLLNTSLVVHSNVVGPSLQTSQDTFKVTMLQIAADGVRLSPWWYSSFYMSITDGVRLWFDCTFCDTPNLQVQTS